MSGPLNSRLYHGPLLTVFLTDGSNHTYFMTCFRSIFIIRLTHENIGESMGEALQMHTVDTKLYFLQVMRESLSLHCTSHVC